MKKLLLATTAFVVLAVGSASAADLRPAYKAAPPPPPMYSWTGLYWGVNVGYSWGRDKNEWNLIGFGTVSELQKMDGVIGGFQSGYNYQFGQWVLGLETDIQASGQKGSSIYGIAPGVTLSADHKLPWFGTSRTRLGVLVSPTVLLYGTAGVAYGQVKQDYTLGVAGRRLRDRELQGRAGRLDCRRRCRRGHRGWLDCQARVPLHGSRPADRIDRYARSRHGLQLEQPRDRQHRARRLQLPLGRRRLLIADKLLDLGGRLHPQAAPLLCAHGGSTPRAFPAVGGPRRAR